MVRAVVCLIHKDSDMMRCCTGITVTSPVSSVQSAVCRLQIIIRTGESGKRLSVWRLIDDCTESQARSPT